jgi:transcriptional regulator GlxA family with amidase domain
MAYAADPGAPQVRVDLFWGQQVLAGAALAALDMLRSINELAAMRAPRAKAPIAWRWFAANGERVPRSFAGGGFIGTADVLVVPGWHARSGPELDSLVRVADACVARLQRVHAQGGQLLGIFNGSALLARAGLLHQRKAVAPWAFIAPLLRHDESVRLVTDRAWIEDQRLWTCDSPVLATELLLAALRRTRVAHLAEAAAHVYLHSGERQQVAERIVRGAHERVLPAGAVERARRWLEAHMAEPYSLPALARAAATSPRTLLRHFAAAHGQSPLAWLQGLRMARARVLLETTYLPVEQVAHSCGYQDAGTFRRLFVKATGELPAAYREHYRLRTSRRRWRGRT